MPVINKTYFQLAENENPKIWRYMDFMKYVSLLETSTLFFSSAKQLSKIDPYEGSLTKLNHALANKDSNVYQNLILQSLVQDDPNKARKYLEDVHHCQNEFIESTKYYFSKFFINSWHMQEYESAAMWSLYAKVAEGIAIVSNYKNLQDALIDTKEHVGIGKIKYINNSIAAIPVDNSWAPFMHKSQSFDHEKELRMIFDASTNAQYHDICAESKGLYIKINLKALISEIYISPIAEPWVRDLIIAISKKYGIEAPIKVSEILNNPFKY